MSPRPTVDLSLSSYTLQHGHEHQDAPRVLIVEPNPALRIGLADLLRSYGMRVVGTVPTASAAIETIKAQRPTVVIAEPRGHGITIIDELHEVDERLPVIIHSAVGHETQPLIRHYGGFALLTKGETSAAYLAAVISDAHTLYTQGARGC